MKLAATIMSWIGGIITTVIAFVTLSLGLTVVYTNGYNTYTSKADYPNWVWVVAIIAAILRLVILIWRQYSVSEGNKVACGICTLIFCSVIGGILTLCIPESELYGYSHSTRSSSYKPTPTKLTPLDRALLYKEYERQLRDGEISRQEYDRKTAILEAKAEKPASQSQKKPSEDEKIELLTKYKKLCDDGVITEEEFEKKKKDLLN